jgi:hypothetical protein
MVDVRVCLGRRSVVAASLGFVPPPGRILTPVPAGNPGAAAGQALGDAIAGRAGQRGLVDPGTGLAACPANGAANGANGGSGLLVVFPAAAGLANGANGANGLGFFSRPTSIVRPVDPPKTPKRGSKGLTMEVALERLLAPLAPLAPLARGVIGGLEV